MSQCAVHDVYRALCVCVNNVLASKSVTHKHHMMRLCVRMFLLAFGGPHMCSFDACHFVVLFIAAHTHSDMAWTGCLVSPSIFCCVVYNPRPEQLAMHDVPPANVAFKWLPHPSTTRPFVYVCVRPSFAQGTAMFVPCVLPLCAHAYSSAHSDMGGGWLVRCTRYPPPLCVSFDSP